MTLTGQLAGTNGVTAQNYLISFTPSQTFYVAGTALFVGTTSTCATSVDGSVVGMPNPLQQVSITANYSGGTLPAGNYYVEYAFYSANSTTATLVSAEQVVQLTATGGFTVDSPTQGVPAAATGMLVYAGATSGSETLQGSTVGNASYSQTTALTTGATPLANNTTVCRQIANDAGWPTGTGYKVAIYDASGNVVPNYPTLWQLLGPNTVINLTNGLPEYHGVVTFPPPLLAQPYNHNTQSLSGGLNMEGYPLLNVGEITSSGPINGAFQPPTIPGAITRAADVGSVDIPPGYQVTSADAFSSNLYGIYINDRRPKSNPLVPKNEIYASDFGAVCTGTSIDSPAIQSAIDSATWAFNFPLQLFEQDEIVLPQGSCGVVAPITFTGFQGSMVGKGNEATALVGLYNQWVGADNDVIDIVATGTYQGGASIGVRRLADFSVIGEGDETVDNVVATGIRIWNTSNNYDVAYGLRNIDFEHLLVAQFDLCIDAEDLVNSQFQFNQIQNCRIGLQFNGSVQNNYVAHNTIDSGTLSFTPKTGGTIGFNVQQNVKYGSGSEQPQGVYFHDNSIENWTTGILDEECIACAFDYNQLDLISGTGVQIDENGIGGYGVWLDHNEIGIDNNTATAVLLAGISDPTVAKNNGFWLEDNQLELDNYPGVEPSTDVGISLQSVDVLAEAHITGNQCMGMAECILLGQDLQYSFIENNTAIGTLTYVVNLAGAASLNHLNTIVDKNFDYAAGVPAINVGSSSGAVILFNCTTAGCTTPTYPTLAVGNGFTGVKTAGSCVITIAAGIITDVTGC